MDHHTINIHDIMSAIQSKFENHTTIGPYIINKRLCFRDEYPHVLCDLGII